MADHLLEEAAARAQVGARGIEAGDGVGAARLGLRDVRACHLADGERSWLAFNSRESTLTLFSLRRTSSWSRTTSM